MMRGPRSHRSIACALGIARQRGKVQVSQGGPEHLYDFTITATEPVAFVLVKFAGRILSPLAEIGAIYHDEIIRLNLITNNTTISRELWLRSKHGTWRFFRIAENGLVELDRDGQPRSCRAGKR